MLIIKKVIKFIKEKPNYLLVLIIKFEAAILLESIAKTSNMAFNVIKFVATARWYINLLTYPEGAAIWPLLLASLTAVSKLISSSPTLVDSASKYLLSDIEEILDSYEGFNSSESYFLAAIKDVMAIIHSFKNFEESMGFYKRLKRFITLKENNLKKELNQEI